MEREILLPPLLQQWIAPYRDGPLAFFFAQHQQELLVWSIAAWVVLLGGMGALYVWVASRQVRPRQAPPASPSLPTSPTSKRKRHSKSFSDMQELEREFQLESAAMDRHDWSTLPMSLQRKCTPEQCKLIYDALAQVFSFVRVEYIDALAHDLQIHKLAKGQSIFEMGEHDGSILMVAAGEATVSIHGDGPEVLKKRVIRGETITSSLPLLASVLSDLGDEEASRELLKKSAGCLSAIASEEQTVIFKIPPSAVIAVLQQYPDSFLRLAQAALNQVEKGYLPPISENGSLLLDGGYMNNLPADVMKEEGGIKYVLAVDVGAEPRHEYFGYGSALSGWWLLWNKLNPFASTVIVPSMGDVSAALAYVSSEQHKERMKTECIDLYLRPPVNDYGTLEFDKMEEIIQVGYDYALPQDAELDAEFVESGESDFEGNISS
ncbi:hypothetical protein ATCC90586_002577 [Pythium insidiosum]|nr:hypothetical protein ATCC90586_002577 [Pythium insidiosum]